MSYTRLHIINFVYCSEINKAKKFECERMPQGPNKNLEKVTTVNDNHNTIYQIKEAVIADDAHPN